MTLAGVCRNTMSHQAVDGSLHADDGAGGHDRGKDETNENSGVIPKTKANKSNCSVCKKSTKRIPANKDGGVKCGVCQFWWHPKCLNMDPELLKWIMMGEKLGNYCCWTCQHCQEAHLKTEQVIKAMSSRLKTVEQKVDHAEVRQEQMEDKQELSEARQEKVNSEFQERLRKLELGSGGGAMKEIDDRMEKLNNLVVHRVAESSSEEPRERQAHDAALIKVLMEKYLVIKDMDTENKVRFIKRLGVRPEGREMRPILIGLKFTSDMELVLDRSWMLGQSNNKAAQEINIVRDLTAKQRQREVDMVSEAARKNVERSQEDLDQNLVFKVVGRKGDKREIKVTLRRGEKLDEAGNVVRDEWVRGNNGGFVRPPVTGGNSEPLGEGRAEARSLPPAQVVNNTPVITSKPSENIVVEDIVRNINKESGDWEWEAAAGKRGRASPSPDKVMKKVRSGGELELKNRFQQKAESMFRTEDRNLL